MKMGETRMKKDKKTADRLIIGITGASGVQYGVKALQLLATTSIETHLVISSSAERTILEETDYVLKDVKALADVVHNNKDIGASIASGSFKSRGMLIAPCSVKTMGEIASSIGSSLMTRAADVVLKERRRLVLMVRETPLHTGHLRIMTHLSEIGAIIAPPMPAFYTKPDTIDDLVTQSVSRTLDLFDIDHELVKRWGEDVGPLAR